MKRVHSRWAVVLFLLVGIAGATQGADGSAAASSAEPLQAALDAEPGAVVYVSAGVHRINRPLVIRHDGAGLYGPGTIVQTDDDADILQIDGAANVRIEGITLTRERPAFFKTAFGIKAVGCHHIRLTNVTVRGNRAKLAAVYLQDSDYARVEGCDIIDFKTIAIDDRMNNDLYRYAFRAIDGHGLYVRNCKGVRIVRNRVIETELRATPEVMKRYELGKIVNRAEELGELASYGVRDGFVFIWHQGGGILLNDAERMAFGLLDGNYIENAAQGMDLHGDFLIVTNNHVTNCYMGMKAFHGARGIVISGNIFHQPGKYGILLRPGSESHEAAAATDERSARAENVERGIIISNNLITDQGYGDEHWRLWNDDPTETSPVGIKIGTGPLARNPRLRDIVIQGNIVHDHGRDGILVDGEPRVEPPRYKWAIWFDDEWRAENVRLSGNIFHPGEKGVSNLPLEP